MRLTILFTLLLFPFISQSQVLKGVIYDAEGGTIPFARIGIKNSTYATLANGEGKYQLQLKSGTYILEISASTYEKKIDTIQINSLGLVKDYTLGVEGKLLEETEITARSRRDLAKEIMQKVIDQRNDWENAIKDYECNFYSFTGIELEVTDSIERDSVVSKKKMNIAELYTHSYVKNGNIYKDSILGNLDLSDKERYENVVTVQLDAGDGSLQTKNAPETNPYLFVQGLKTADINLFKNQLDKEQLSFRPLISPLAYNAFVYYIFILDGSFFDENGREINKITVTPRFREEALYSGTLYISNDNYHLLSADLEINKAALNYFKDLHLLIDYTEDNGRLYPNRREYNYVIKEGRQKYNGQIRSIVTNYKFQQAQVKSNFWLSEQIDHPSAYDRDSAYWLAYRPFTLKEEEVKFIHQQDSIEKYYQSEAYLKERDSTYNTLSIWDFLFNGVGFRNTFKKQEIYIGGLINQVVPFGVGGYRHRLSGSYSKGFKNGMQFDISPTIDYGFYNKDLKGEVEVDWLYNPMRFSKIHMMGGDIYDLVTNYQSIQGTFAPANRVRNQKFEVSHAFEVVNGLYLKTGIFYSKRGSISGIKYPSWVDLFGNFATPSEFEDYNVLVSEIGLEYHFRQKYLIQRKQKIITSDKWPVVNLTYKKGIPGLLGGQANFDFAELRVRDNIYLGTLGNSEFKFVAGSFIQKKDLRLIEYKYFRTSDFFFSNPLNSQQLLDTLLSTSNNYMQFNFIHHFEGFFLNKVWLLNRLKLEETVGGSFLGIPDANFTQAELYVGLERKIRIKKQIFKVGVYAVTAASSFDSMKFTYKFGINFYDSFYKKWDY